MLKEKVFGWRCVRYPPTRLNSLTTNFNFGGHYVAHRNVTRTDRCPGILDGRLLGVSMIDRPLVMCALTGLVCGNLHEGILIGATLELIFLGNVAIGAAHPPDIVTGSVLATAFSIMSGRGPEAALTIAIPVSMLAQTLGIWCAW